MLKVRDKVKLQYFEENDYIQFALDMHQYIGKITKIRGLNSSGSSGSPDFLTYFVEGNIWEWINLKKINSIQSKLK